jgi:hypothetical protein
MGLHLIVSTLMGNGKLALPASYLSHNMPSPLLHPGLSPCLQWPMLVECTHLVMVLFGFAMHSSLNWLSSREIGPASVHQSVMVLHLSFLPISNLTSRTMLASSPSQMFSPT